MKKIYLVLFASLISNFTIAQIAFEEVLPLPPTPPIIAEITPVGYSSVAFADVDNDGDQDILVIGAMNHTFYKTFLYINDGLGNFSINTNSQIRGVQYGTIDFLDIDADNDLDLLVTGIDGYSTTSLLKSSQLYRNDGTGKFSKINNAPFVGVSFSSTAILDIDNDSDLDIIITGEDESLQVITKTYINDGTGDYTLAANNNFTPTNYGYMATADIDGDSDLDILITGLDSVNTEISTLYVNDGVGGFAAAITPFDSVAFSATAFADIDGDNDQDVLITGWTASGIVSKLYTNDGNGTYSVVSGTPFEPVYNSSIDFADIDGDNDLDVVISGQILDGTLITKIYTNAGNGNFTLKANTTLEGINYGASTFADVDNDNDQDLLLVGYGIGTTRVAKLYINDNTGNFTWASGSPIVATVAGDASFSDVDADGDQDLLVTGKLGDNITFVSKLYANDGAGNFSLIPGTPFVGVAASSIAFADIDGDNDEDVLITGQDENYLPSANLYTNDGTGNFMLVAGTAFDGVKYSSIAFADVDGDNDLDVLITGTRWVVDDYYPSTILYLNDGNGNFTKDTVNIFALIEYGSVAFADIDGDNDQDLLFIGMNTTTNIIAKLYINDGVGNFSSVNGTPFEGIYSSSIAFADLDGDNDMDVLISGRSPDTESIYYGSGTYLYTNDGSGNFSLDPGAVFDGANDGAIAIKDFDSDNDLDVLIAGENSGNGKNTINLTLYASNGSGGFSKVEDIPFKGVMHSSIATADIDADGDEDIFISGSNSGYLITSNLYRNNTCPIVYGTDVATACDSFTWIDSITYTADTTTVFNILGGSANGCDSLVTLNLTILQLAASTDIQTVCDSLTWIDGIIYTADTTTVFNIIGGAVNGCDSLVTLNLTVNSADATVTTSAAGITANASGAAYQWLDCENGSTTITGQTGQSFAPSIGGSYAVEVTENGCTNVSECITIAILSITENPLFNNVSIYPNPNRGTVNIDLGELKDVSVTVYNMSGQQVYFKANINTSQHQFKLADDLGVYIIEINAGGEQQRYKLIKEY